MLLSDFDQTRTNPAVANDQNALVESEWTASRLVGTEPGWAVHNFDGVVSVRPTQNLEDFGPNLISCVENGPESPELYIMTTIRSGFLLTPIRMTLMILNARFILELKCA